MSWAIDKNKKEVEQLKKVLEEADAVAVPNIGHKRQTAYAIAEAYLEGKELIDCSTPSMRISAFGLTLRIAFAHFVAA